jgi:hypothetical protein
MQRLENMRKIRPFARTSSSKGNVTRCKERNRRQAQQALGDSAKSH